MAWFETNYAKKYAISSQVMYIDRSLYNSQRYQIDFNQKLRLSDKFSISHGMTLEPQKRNVGFADHQYYDANLDEFVPTYSFGRRDIATVENTLNFKYSFNSKMNLNTRVRHYWRKVKYDQLFDLLPDGSLTENNYNPSEANQNYNAFTVDAVFTWEYAPGSFINLVWKNNTEDFNRFVTKNYFKNFSSTMDADQNNNISFKIIYFLDYLQLKKKKKI
jgi:hypothetical protein